MPEFSFRFAGDEVVGTGLLPIITMIASRSDRPVSEVVGLSGLAFTSYAFTPDDNYNWAQVHPGVTAHPSVFTLDHFGVLETLGPHLGADFRIYEPDTVRDFVLLLKSELSAGRGCWLAPPARSVHADPEVAVERWRWVDPDGTEEPTAIPLTPESLKSAPPFARVMAVRPLAQAVPTSRRHMLVREVVRYAARHGESGREVAHAHDVYLASGARAWSVMADWVASEACRPEPARLFADQWLLDQAQRRQHASVFLHQWHEALGRDAGRWPEPSGASDELPAAGGHALVMSALLEEARRELIDDRPERAAAALREVARVDRDKLIPSLKRIEDPSTGLWL